MYVPRCLAALACGILAVLLFAGFQAQVIGKAEPLTARSTPHPSQLRHVTTVVDGTGVILAPTTGRGFVVTHVGFATDAGATTTSARTILELDGAPLFALASSGVAGFGFGFHTDLGTGLQVAPGSVLTLRQGNYVPVGQIVTVMGYTW